MLLGNGDIGVCVTTRPDALGLHLGKEDSWDIRVSEDHYQHVLPFKKLLKLWERASQEAKRLDKPELLFLEREIDFFREYTEKVESSYRKSWPRPWPCGISWIHWDPRFTQVAQQTLDISNGFLTIDLEHHEPQETRSRQIRITVFVHAEAGQVSVSTDAEAPFLSLAYYPNIEPEAKLPPPELDAVTEMGGVRFTAYQHFPATAPSEQNPNPSNSDLDRSFFSLRPAFGRVDCSRADRKPATAERDGLSGSGYLHTLCTAAKSFLPQRPKTNFSPGSRTGDNARCP